MIGPPLTSASSSGTRGPFRGWQQGELAPRIGAPLDQPAERQPPRLPLRGLAHGLHHGARGNRAGFRRARAGGAGCWSGNPASATKSRATCQTVRGSSRGAGTHGPLGLAGSSGNSARPSIAEWKLSASAARTLSSSSGLGPLSDTSGCRGGRGRSVLVDGRPTIGTRRFPRPVRARRAPRSPSRTGSRRPSPAHGSTAPPSPAIAPRKRGKHSSPARRRRQRRNPPAGSRRPRIRVSIPAGGRGGAGERPPASPCRGPAKRGPKG